MRWLLIFLFFVPSITSADMLHTAYYYGHGGSGGGTPTGSISGFYAAPGASVNLSTNTGDWVKWGRTSASDIDSKYGAFVIPAYTQIGSANEVWADGIGVDYSWTGGMPTPSASNIDTQLYITGEGGWQWVFPASESTRTIKLYVRTYNGTGRLTASMPGATAYTNDHTRANSGENRVYTIEYSGYGNLTLSWQTYGGSGTICIQAITVDAPTAAQLTAGLEAMPSSTNLTTEGLTDWKQYAETTASDVNEKSGASVLPDYTKIGSSALLRNVSVPKFSWTDGTPSATGTDVNTRVILQGDGSGFQFVIPSTTETRTARFYFSAYHSKIKCSASMTGADTQTHYYDVRDSGGQRVFEVSFSGSSDVTVRIETDGIATGGDVSLFAVTLATSGDDPPPPPPPDTIDIYVSTSGGGDGSSAESPTTLASALSSATSGDMIGLADGSYGIGATTAIPAGVSLTATDLTDPPGVRFYPTANLSKTVPMLSLTSASPGSSGNQTISYIEFDGIDGAYKSSLVFLVQNRSDVTIEHCYFHDFYTTPNVPGSTYEQYDYSMIVKSSQMAETAEWWNYWPEDPQEPGTDTNIDAAGWPSNPVEGFKFNDNRVIDCFPLHPFNLKNSEFKRNYVDNTGTCSHWLKGTCAFLWNVDVTDNTVYGEQVMDTTSANSTWRIELWMHRGGCEYSRNIMDGWYSITVGKETTIADNVMIKNPGDFNYQTAIEFNQQSYGTISGNYISGAGGYCARIGSDGPNNGDWIYEHVVLRNNICYDARFTGFQVQAEGAWYTTTTTQHVRDMYLYHNVVDGQTSAERGDEWYRTDHGLNIKQATDEGECEVYDIRFKNNVSMDVTGYAGNASGTIGSGVVVANNLFWGCNNNSWSGTGAVTGTIVQEPNFTSEGVNYAGYTPKTSPTSPLIDAGTWLTTITTSSGSGTSFILDDAGYFRVGDEIQLEGDASAITITSIDFNTGSVSVDASVSWSAGDGVALPYNGSAPDIGAIETE